jgi:hypothetical protein
MLLVGLSKHHSIIERHGSLQSDICRGLPSPAMKSWPGVTR